MKRMSVTILFFLLAFTLLPSTTWAALSQTQVSQLYVSIFGRASEGEGNTYWQTIQGDMVVAADTMLATGAAKDYFGATLDDDQAFIEFIYENTLGKTYKEDPDGVDYWVGELASGKSKGQVTSTLVNAVMDPKYAGMASQNRFINKVTVCDYTADTIDTCPNVNDLSAFVGFISGVTDDLATVTTAKEIITQSSLNDVSSNGIEVLFADSMTSESSEIQPYMLWYLGSDSEKTTLQDIYAKGGRVIFTQKLNDVASSKQFWFFVER